MTSHSADTDLEPSLTKREFCAIERMSPVTFWRECKRGKIETYNAGRQVRVTRAAHRAYRTAASSVRLREMTEITRALWDEQNEREAAAKYSYEPETFYEITANLLGSHRDIRQAVCLR